MPGLRANAVQFTQPMPVVNAACCSSPRLMCERCAAAALGVRANAEDFGAGLFYDTDEAGLLDAVLGNQESNMPLVINRPSCSRCGRQGPCRCRGRRLIRNQEAIDIHALAQVLGVNIDAATDPVRFLTELKRAMADASKWLEGKTPAPEVPTEEEREAEMEVTEEMVDNVLYGGRGETEVLDTAAIHAEVDAEIAANRRQQQTVNRAGQADPWDPYTRFPPSPGEF